MIVDPVTADAGGLTDGQVRHLINVYESMAVDPTTPRHWRRWYGQLADELQRVRGRRSLAWSEFLADASGCPLDWRGAVASLPDEPQ